MEIKNLVELGLTEAEAIIYTSLLSLGEAKVGDIIKKSKISSSNTHKCLEKLFQKGLISFVVKNNIKHYYATDPKSLQKMLEKEKDEIEHREVELKKLIPELSKIKQVNKVEQNAEMFFGFNGLKSAFEKLCNPLFKGEEAYFMHKYDSETVEYVDRFFFKLDLSGEYKHVPSKGIMSKEYVKYFKRRKGSTVEIKVTDYPIPSNLNIYHNKVLFISWSKEPTAFLIESEQIAKSFKELFNELWNKS